MHLLPQQLILAGRDTFSVQGGAMYRITRFYGAAIGFKFHYVAPQAPTIIQQPQSGAFDSRAFVNLQVVVRGTTFFTYQWEKDGVDIPGATDWSYRFTTSALTAGSYRVRITNAGGSVISAPAIVQVTTPPGNDQLADATILMGTNVTATGTNEGSTLEEGEPNRDRFIWWSRSVWWSWTAPVSGTVALNTFGSTFDTILAVYTGTDISNLALTASNDNIGWAPQGQSELSFVASEGERYSIAVGSAISVGIVKLNLSYTTDEAPRIVAHPGDRTMVAGSSPAKYAGPDWATFEVRTEGTQPLYYQWRFDGIDLPGETNSSLLFHAGIDQIGSHTLAFVAQNVFGSASTEIRLTILGPAVNDNFANALPISGPASTVTGHNIGATAEFSEGSHGAFGNYGSVWWKWTAPISGPFSIDTFGSSFDTVLAVYTGTELGQLQLIVVNNNATIGANSVIQSLLSFDAVAGMIYHIVVCGMSNILSDRSGAITLTIHPSPSEAHPFASLSLSNPTILELKMEGPAGLRWRVEQTIDLISGTWEPLGEIVPTDSVLFTNVICATNSQRRFYRVLSYP